MPLIAIGLTVAMMVGACAGSQPAEPPSVDPIKIGTLFDYTGDLATYGPPIRGGADLAAKHINEAGGILGRKLELMHKDSQTSPQVGVEAARSLVDIDKVPAVVGALFSGVTVSVAESVTIPKAVTLISPASTSPALTALTDNDFVFRTTPSDALQGVALARVAKELGFKSAATMYINGPYGQGISDKFKEAFDKAGGKVTATVPHDSVQSSYTAELKKATEGKPEVLVAISYPESANIYLKEAIEGNYIKKFLFVDGLKSPEMIQKIGAQYLNGMYGTAPGLAETGAGKVFKDAYKASYGELPPKRFIGEAYDATVLIALAIQKAGKAEGPSIKDALRFVAGPPGEKVGPGPEGIKKALELLKQGKDIDYEGAGGSHNFDANGDVVTTIEVWNIKDGKIETVRYETP